jgi:hypothetical protein
MLIRSAGRRSNLASNPRFSDTDVMPEDERTSKTIPLNYAVPAKTPAVPSRFKFHLAFLFSILSTVWGILWFAAGVGTVRHSWRIYSPRGAREEFSDGVRMILCGVILIAPGLWYGRVGVRGLKK